MPLKSMNLRFMNTSVDKLHSEKMHDLGLSYIKKQNITNAIVCHL